jgi:hypothetical protein
MTIKTLFRLLSPALAVAIISACASNPIAEWQDEHFIGPVDNILIIGASEQPAVRRLFEDSFVRELAAIGIIAKPSYNVMPPDQAISRESVEAALADQAMDAVLVSRLLGVDEVQTYNPPSYYPYHRSYHSYYGHAMDYSSPGYYGKYKLLTLETNLYDTATEKLVWSMQSESIDPSTPKDVIEEQIHLTIKTLGERGLIAPAL